MCAAVRAAKMCSPIHSWSIARRSPPHHHKSLIHTLQPQTTTAHPGSGSSRQASLRQLRGGICVYSRQLRRFPPLPHDQAESAVLCSTCESYLCAPCQTATHKAKVFASHKIVDVASSPHTDTSTCRTSCRRGVIRSLSAHCARLQVHTTSPLRCTA